MIGDNVQSSRGVTLVGSASPDTRDIALAMDRAPVLVAADGGANFCLREGIFPHAVIGDFDSLDPDARAALPDTRFLHVSEQDSTDFEKCLTRIEAPFVLATGFTADRLDHTLAVLSTLARQVGPPTVILGTHDIVFAAPTELALALTPGSRLSLFPMGPVAGRSTGLRWPIEGLSFAPAGLIGTSNEVTGPVRLSFDMPGCLVITPRDALDPVLEALLGPVARPVR